MSLNFNNLFQYNNISKNILLNNLICIINIRDAVFEVFPDNFNVIALNNEMTEKRMIKFSMFQYNSKYYA